MYYPTARAGRWPGWAAAEASDRDARCTLANTPFALLRPTFTELAGKLGLDGMQALTAEFEALAG
jgi:hypothetical protein